ncbi:MMPL family transporter [Streptomyces iakyrus]|uniref:MMPL family transporter n=1 Tax=Streptomyces iakyrus TaxID=68219 RepID=UPI000996AF3F|nr:MMPL family transporter [Streptomyces iakyrus]
MSDHETQTPPPSTAGTQPSPAAPEAGAPAPDGALARWGRFCARHRIAVLVLALAATVLAGVLGAGAGDRMGSGGLTDPDTPSAQAQRILESRFDAGDPQLVLLAEASGSVDEPGAVSAGTALTDRVRGIAGVRGVDSYWSEGRPESLRSEDGRIGLLLLRLDGDEDASEAVAARVVDQVGGKRDGLTVRVTGAAQLDREIDAQAEKDLTRAELLTAPLTLLILVLVFGSAVAAGLPLLAGIVAIVGTLAVLRAITAMTDVSVFSLNLTTALGLGLAIDYSLFLITRHREELRAGRKVHDAIAVAMHTAGRTVLFSAITVALALTALLVFPGYFLPSFAYAGIAVALLTAAVTLVVLPALLALAGHRINSLDLRGLLRGRRTAAARGSAREGAGAWRRLALAVMRRSVLFTLVTVTLLAGLATPFVGVEFGINDHRTLPQASAGYQASEQLRTRFDSRETTATPIVLDGRVNDAALSEYAATVSRLPHVSRVDTALGSYISGKLAAPPSDASARFRAEDRSAWLSAVTDVEPISADGTALVERVRDLDSPAPVLVGGDSATLVDTRDAIGERLPWAALIVAVATALLLFALTGSVLIPLQAIALSLISLTAAFGAMVYVFQDGHLRGLIGDFTTTGWVDVTAPVLMFCIAYGLAMDYQVFLLSRIKEEYDHSSDNTAAVAAGLERTGRLVTAAAVLIAVVLGALAISGITYLKMLGVGLTLAVLVDAFIVRTLLMPALMRLFGSANWWAPGRLHRLHDRLGLRH